ncbi:hypothetical protein DSO57_1004063 [Entomophthora muscae]|uniref:Uncharacterized protein n=2 Tax=Entomophthora muscae TaxID=34485 RepID=A0ACC2U6R8_9FUNG|nr:hypothetical protein DSO57_1004063 [Entomophthora muscae]
MSFNSSYKPLWQQGTVVGEAARPKEKKPSRLKERAKERREAKLKNTKGETSDSNLKSSAIVATSQVSRFHTETLETLAKEVDLKQVNITVNDQDLLVDAKLLIKASTRYGLIGRNGVGKSTLLKVIGDGSLIGLPANLRVLAIQQISNPPPGLRVIDAVLEADAAAMRAVREAKALSEGEKTVETVSELLAQRAYDEMVEAQKIATHRSGMRGKDARAVALQAEKKYAEAKALIAADKEVLSKTITVDAVNGMVSQIFGQLALVDISGAEARARKILLGLGFDTAKMDGELQALSGGWRMRVSLAKALFYAPDLLLLDEPTNHLDLPAIQWLQNYLVEEFSPESAVVVVSHDRNFLNGVAQEIILLRDKTLTYHAGNYDVYESSTEDLRRKKERMHACIERRRKHIQSSIDKAVAHARASGDDKRLGMVASRKIRLEKMGMNKTEDGKRFKQSYRAGFQIDYRPQVVLDKKEAQVVLPVPDPDPLRTAGPLVHLEKVSFSYPGLPPTVSKVSLTVEQHSRIALVGANGSGKSTLMSLMQGDVVPSSGKVERHSSANFGVFSQHQVESLTELQVSAVAFLREEHPGLTEQEARQWLGSYGLSGSIVTGPVSRLSGGQKARVILANILMEGPHLLLLDEVTNHLDLPSIEALALSLNNYEGAVVCISHDQWFLDAVATDSYTLKKGKLCRVKASQ